MLGADAKHSPLVLRDWRRFDDSYVERCDDRDDIPGDSSTRAYLLFYMRRGYLPQPLAEPLAEPLAQLPTAQSSSNISTVWWLRWFKFVSLTSILHFYSSFSPSHSLTSVNEWEWENLHSLSLLALPRFPISFILFLYCIFELDLTSTLHIGHGQLVQNILSFNHTS